MKSIMLLFKLAVLIISILVLSSCSGGSDNSSSGGGGGTTYVESCAGLSGLERNWCLQRGGK